MRIRPRLMITTATVIGAMLLSGGIGLFFTDYVTRISDALVENETEPLVKVQKIESHLSELWLKFISHASLTEPSEMKQVEDQIEEIRRGINQEVSEFGQSILSRTDVEQDILVVWQDFNIAWEKLQALEDQALELSHEAALTHKSDEELSEEEKKQQVALKFMLQGEGWETYHHVVLDINQMVDLYDKHVHEMKDQADNAEVQAFVIASITTLLLSILILFMLNRFANGLVIPLQSANAQLHRLSEGRAIDGEIPVYHDDEVAEMAKSIERLRRSAEGIVAQANAIAQGDYSQDVELRSEEDQLGHALFNMSDKLRNVVQQAYAIAQGNYDNDFTPLSERDQLGTALADMTVKLRDITADNEAQDWLKSGQNQLNEVMSGEQEIAALARKITAKLCAYLDVPIGAFYLTETADEDTVLRLIAGYAYTTRKHLASEFKLGDGLIGQAALEGQQIYLTKAPTDYLSVQSGLGEASPGHVIVTPFFYEGTLKGIIELGAFSRFTELQQELLNLVLPRIGITINACEAHNNMGVLLKQSQVQTEQLQTQSEELQAQSEELQSQQEELRQANEELAEHMNELERQRNDIRQKNETLESTQAEMRENQRMLSTLMSNLPGMVYRAGGDDDMTMLFVSEGSLDLTEYQPEDLANNKVLSYYDVIHEEDREQVRTAIRECLAQQTPFQLTYRILTRTGRQKWVHEQGLGIYDDDGELLYLEGFVTDTTERKKAQDGLERSNQYKSEFLANMSHELRTPLNSLLILSQLLSENKNGNLDEKQVTQAETINGSGRDLLNLINDILDLSKVEAGKLDVHVEAINLKALNEEFTRKFEPVAGDKGIDFDINLATQLPDTISTDGQRMKQVLNNLLSNALKFTEAGQVSMIIARPDELPLSLQDKLALDNSLMFQVKDTGIGIPEDKQLDVFEAFQQVDGTVSRRFGGTGLGLSISRELARLLGGDIELYSRPGEGSIFTLYLPEKSSGKAQENLTEENPSEKEERQVVTVEQRVERQIDTAVKPVVKTAEPVKKLIDAVLENTTDDDRGDIQENDKTLLIIEDDRDFAQTLRSIAQEQHFKCLIALDGQQGLDMAEEFQPDAVFLDIGLPKVDGWSVLDRLKNTPNTRHIPIHCVSGADEKMTARRMGAIGYLMKPVGMTELVDALHRTEQFLDGHANKLLLISSDLTHQMHINESIAPQGIEIETVNKLQAARLRLQSKIDNEEYGCIVLDIDVGDGQVIALLECIQGNETLNQIPVVLYAERELTETEALRLRHLEEKLVVKPVYSPERLLEESSLFLHQVESQLPEEKRKILTLMHDKEALLNEKKVLIVDDDMRNFFALAAALEDRHMHASSAKNGQEALDFMEKEAFDIVLMDIMMPVMDGYETMRRIRSETKYRNLPIIALTAKAMKEDKAKCIDAGASDYLSKPVDTNKLFSLMRVWLYR
ncbi:MAG: response regulator [Pseudomonadota bacterium]